MWNWRQVGVRAVNTRHKQGIVKLVCPQVSIRQFILSPLAMHCEAAVTGEVLPRLWVSFLILLLTSLCIYFPSCTTYRSLEAATQTSRDSLTQGSFWLYTQTFTRSTPILFFLSTQGRKNIESTISFPIFIGFAHSLHPLKAPAISLRHHGRD